VPLELIEKIRVRVDPLFSGQFETGVYPDEWHWRKGLSLPAVTREMCNVWKSDRLIASLVLSSKLGRFAAQLGGWTGTRIGQDDLWYKPPGGGKEIAFHRDDSYISSQFVPFYNNTITCWIALDDVSPINGTLAYVVGSHKWPEEEPSKEFHAPQSNWQLPMLEAFSRLKNPPSDKPDIYHVTLRAGGVAFHHQAMWHGSGPNLSTDQPRRSLGIHLIRSDLKFVDHPSYI